MISADTDFGVLLAIDRQKKPSVILLRRPDRRRPDPQLAILLSNLTELIEPLNQGAVAAFEETPLRMRLFPISTSEESTQP